MIGLTTVLAHHHTPSRPPSAEELPLRGFRTVLHHGVSRRLMMISIGLLTMFLSVGFTTTSSILFPSMPREIANMGKEQLCDTGTQDSGYIKLPNKIDGHYFYWYFESRTNPETDPLVLWLTGGPGGSSLVALLTENGPCSILDGKMIRNPYSWTTNANVIWVDQPIGVGFSHGDLPFDYDYNIDDVAENMYYFLQGWLKKHPQFASREFFVTGESFAGHYAPAIAATLATRKPKQDEIQIQLRGVAIGNGWTNPFIQMQHQADLIHENPYNKTLFNNSVLEKYDASVSEVVALATDCNIHNNSSSCVEATSQWKLKLVSPLVAIAGVDRFDIRKQSISHEHPATSSLEHPGILNADLAYQEVSRFLNLPSIKHQLHARKNIEWKVISSDVNQNFAEALFKNADQYITILLSHKVRVLMYAGDADLMCNWKGCEAWMRELEWPGQSEFVSAQEISFSVRNVTHGVYRSAQDLTFLRFFNAGHMVPMDQPQAALEMINRFFNNQPL